MMFTSAKNIAFLMLAMPAFSALNVQAADVPLRGPIPFEAFDKDNNKMISPQEFVEMHNLRKKMREDANMGSGGNPRSFTFFDTNGDNQISPDELNMNRGMGRGMRQGMGPGRGTGPGMAPRRQMPDFSDFDLNGDGNMQRDEFIKAREERMRKHAEKNRMMRNAGNAPSFASIDTNNDGIVSRDEFAAHQAMRRKMMGFPRQNY